MKIALLAITGQGAGLARRIKENNPDMEMDLYFPVGVEDERAGAYHYQGSLQKLFAQIWPEYQGIICIMALGIVVRMTAPLVKDKRIDPAIVVLDEKGTHAISVLSGHWGGANRLAEEIADSIGAEPVITTATDVNGLPAIEMVARAAGLRIENFPLVKKINSALVNGRELGIYTDIDLNVAWPAGVVVSKVSAYRPDLGGPCVLVTNKKIETSGNTLILRPVNLIVGIGCRRGVPAKKIIAAINQVLSGQGYSQASIRTIASIDIKQDEAGLWEAARQLSAPLVFFGRNEINTLYASERGKGLSFSAYVHEKLGVGGVCEAVTLLSSPEAKLVCPKTKMEGVTVALAEASCQL